MDLLNGWEGRLEQAEEENQPPPLYEISLRQSTNYYTNEIKFIDNKKDAQDLLYFARQRPLSFIGISVEYFYQKPDMFIL